MVRKAAPPERSRGKHSTSQKKEKRESNATQKVEGSGSTTRSTSHKVDGKAAPPTTEENGSTRRRERSLPLGGTGSTLFLLCGAAVTIGVFGVVLLSSLLLWIGTAFTIFLDPDICRVLLRIVAFFDVDCGNQRTHCNPLSFFSVQPKS